MPRDVAGGPAAPDAVDPAAIPAPIRADPNPGLARTVLHGLYDAALASAVVLASPWLAWRSARSAGFGRMVRERAGLGAGTTDAPRPADPPRVLVHGVSVGEVKGAAPLVEEIERRWPGLEVVVSTTTNTGFQVARDAFPGRRIVRFPADLRPLVGRFLRRVAPAAVVLVELEVWPNFLRECNRLGVPVAVVNGRITGRSHGRYLEFRRLLPQFNRLSLVCVQDEEYAARFLDLAIDPRRVVRTGSWKADRLPLGPVEPGEELRRLLGAPAGRLVVVAGSTHPGEELQVVRAWRRGAPEARLVLVPRHPERAPDVVRQLAAAGTPCQRLSALRAGAAPEPALPCLVDTIGELERVYGLADLVFVGGSLVPHGGHNLLEPAAQGRAVLFGPHVGNFRREAAVLAASGGGREVADEAALAGALEELAADPAARARMAAAGLEVVRAEKGATRRTVDALSPLLEAVARAGPTRGAQPRA